MNLGQTKKYNVSASLLSYLNYIIFPFGGYGLTGLVEPPPEILALDEEYKALLSQQFDNNTLHLLANLTKPCDQIITACIFGTSLRMADCCKYFGAREYTIGQMCYRTTSEIMFQVQEAGVYNSIAVNIMMNGSGLGGLNLNLINRATALLAGQMAAAVTEKERHTYAVSSRQEIWFCRLLYLCVYAMELHFCLGDLFIILNAVAKC